MWFTFQYSMKGIKTRRRLTGIMKRIFLHRKYILILWGIILFVLWYCFVFYKSSVSALFHTFFVWLPLLWYFLYFVVVSLRGLTFIPLTTLLLVMVPFTNHWILLWVTLLWTLITSYIIYHFSQALQVDDYFEKKYPRAIKKLRKWFEKYEFPIIVLWSVLPFTPTDLICYIAGTLWVNVRKMLLGVLIWELIICTVYIWGFRLLVF